MAVLSIDATLVPGYPQHFHFEIFCYEKMANEQGNFFNSIRFEEIISNDMTLAVSRCLEMAGIDRQQHHVKNVKQCADPKCLKGLEEDKFMGQNGRKGRN